jgi:hypothetical protein
MALPFRLKTLRVKIQIFHHAKTFTSKKILQKKPKSFKISYNSTNNLKVSTQAKISAFKNPHINIDILLLPSGQNPLSYYTL